MGRIIITTGGSTLVEHEGAIVAKVLGTYSYLPGVIPLRRNGEIVAAIGVSTGTVDQDQEVAEAGAVAF